MKIIVTVRKSFPAVDYGVDTYEYTAEKDGVSEADFIAETTSITETLNNTIAAVVLPLVEAEITRFAPSLLKDANPDYSQRGRSKIYAAFRVLFPDVEIPAMAAILASKDVPNRINGGLDMNTPKGKLQGHGKYTQEFEQSDRFPGMADGLPGE